MISGKREDIKHVLECGRGHKAPRGNSRLVILHGQGLLADAGRQPRRKGAEETACKCLRGEFERGRKIPGVEAILASRSGDDDQGVEKDSLCIYVLVLSA